MMRNKLTNLHQMLNSIRSSIKLTRKQIINQETFIQMKTMEWDLQTTNRMFKILECLKYQALIPIKAEKEGRG